MRHSIRGEAFCIDGCFPDRILKLLGHSHVGGGKNLITSIKRIVNCRGLKWFIFHGNEQKCMVSDLWLYKSIYLLFAQQPYFEMSPSITPALGCVTLCIAVALNKQQRGDLGPEVRASRVFSVSPVILSSLLDIGWYHPAFSCILH